MCKIQLYFLNTTDGKPKCLYSSVLEIVAMCYLKQQFNNKAFLEKKGLNADILLLGVVLPLIARYYNSTQ